MLHQPKVVVLRFDGMEVLRLENGSKCFERQVLSSYKPNSIEMIWDGKVVYAILDGKVQLNCLQLLMPN